MHPSKKPSWLPSCTRTSENTRTTKHGSDSLFIRCYHNDCKILETLNQLKSIYATNYRGFDREHHINSRLGELDIRRLKILIESNRLAGKKSINQRAGRRAREVPVRLRSRSTAAREQVDGGAGAGRRRRGSKPTAWRREEL